MTMEALFPILISHCPEIYISHRKAGLLRVLLHVTPTQFPASAQQKSGSFFYRRLQTSVTDPMIKLSHSTLTLKLLVSWWLRVLRLWPAMRVRSVTHRVKATSDDLCSVGELPAACWPFVFVNVLGLRSPHSLHCLAGPRCREQVYLQKAHIKRAKVSKPMRMMSEISCVHVC